MTARGRTLFVITICLLGLAGAFVSCNDADDGDAPATGNAATGDGARPPATQPGGMAERDEPAEPADPPAAASVYVTGDEVYKAANCEMCHGKELQGSKLAPPLAGLTANWNATSLAEYLVDPVGYTENDPRLKATQDDFSLPMPAWKQTGLGEPDMQLLIDWLLAQE